jgi:hypothetical protein
MFSGSLDEDIATNPAQGGLESIRRFSDKTRNSKPKEETDNQQTPACVYWAATGRSILEWKSRVTPWSWTQCSLRTKALVDHTHAAEMSMDELAKWRAEGRSSCSSVACSRPLGGLRVNRR